MDKVLRLIWIFSIIGFFGTFFYTYAGLEGMVEIGVYEDMNKFFLTKNEFFYSVFGLFIVSSGLFLASSQFIKNMEPKSSFLNNSEKKRSNFLSSIYLCGIGVNILLVSFVAFVGFVNNPSMDEGFNPVSMLYLGFPFIVISLILMVYTLVRKYD
ncbi:hypothetical protein [Marinigracilibium pacificum]|uniref:Uncharacterized protein n=1 Tax=Marinigracilibium pacificum TaxID=2729599 RepID=A0A848J7N4_9BACT|nr:hypothetical protein [Marinigracilibium pacificum]NMM50434.1 hypothetical protein [Marinigracilibium pacificum]